MSLAIARKIADAVLYEGYVLYPYRPSSLKNQFRWQFGVVAPRSWDGDPSLMQTECGIEPEASPVLDVVVRFLQVQPKTNEWDEGIERTIELRGITRDCEERFEFAPLVGVVRVTWRDSKIRVAIENLSDAAVSGRNEAMRHSFVGTHTLLSISGGQFVSALDSPDCENLHTWPVLVGSRNVMLSSPIILQDYPSVAPESPGDFFDGTEIDEMLTLRVMTMTEEEKREAASADDRARRIVERCDRMGPRTLERLHGTIRGEEFFNPQDFFNPEEEQPETQSVAVGAGSVSRGSRVRLVPRGRADSMDMFLKGRTAVVESVHHDLDDRAYVAVTVEDDPGAGIYNRFYYFFPDELELIEKES